MRQVISGFAILCVGGMIWSGARAEDRTDETRTSTPTSAATAAANPAADGEAGRFAARQALELFNPLIGEWRGVGQLQRNSAKGSWKESGEWVWQLKKDAVAIRYDVHDGKYITSALLTYEPQKKLYVLLATLADNSPRRYEGTLADKKLTLESAVDSEGKVHQLVVTQLNDKRTLVLFQQRNADQERFARVAEVGYTREGTRLAEEGAGEPVCIVTGGKGTSKIDYKGKTYWFCCSGCRDAFNDDPDGVIADAEEKAAKKKAEEAGKKKSGT